MVSKKETGNNSCIAFMSDIIYNRKNESRVTNKKGNKIRLNTF